MIHFLVASQRMALVFYFLPTLYSAYYFGRRHATMTACASVALVIGLTLLNPAMFSHHHELVLPIDTRWIDLTIWGGVLVIAAYAMGTLYERNQKSLIEMKAGYEGMLAVLQQFLTNQKYSEAHSYRISMYATRIAESLVSETRGGKMSPAQAVESIAKGFGSKYDSMIVDAFVKAFGQQAAGAGAS